MTAALSQDFARVVHATDLSPDGEAAFAHALRLALAAKGRICLVHASDTQAVGHEWSAYPKVRERLILWKMLPPGAPEESVGDLHLHVSKADLDCADTAGAVAAYAELHGCDLLVLATHARRGVDRWLSPAVAEPMARASKAPTLFIPAGAKGFIDAQTGEAGLRNILVAFDRSPDPAQAIAGVAGIIALLEVAGAVVHFLHVGSQAPDISAYSQGLDSRWLTRDTGDVVATICKAADDIDADLIVMTTRGHDGLMDSVHGSKTERVLRQAGRAVLAVPER